MRIAIVGAGPAGSLCAERLARAGCEVAIFDPSHPREKPCGGGVTPGAFERHAELAALRELGRPVDRVRLRTRAGRAVGVAIPQPIVIFSRSQLDGALLARAREAGAEHVPERVRRVRVEAGSVCLDVAGGMRHFDFAVGADGAASVVRRCLLGHRPGGAAGYATAGFWVEGLPESEIGIEFLPDMSGYLWSFPRSDHSSVGIAAPIGRLNGAELQARVEAWLARVYPGSQALPRRRYAASIPSPTPAQARGAVLGGRRFALIGDAANQVDAITAEGIHHALDAAALLAEALLEAGTQGAADLYQHRWRRGPGREIERAARWARRYYRPSTADLMLRLGGRSRRARRIMADLLMARQPYTKLLDRCWQEVRSG